MFVAATDAYGGNGRMCDAKLFPLWGNRIILPRTMTTRDTRYEFESRAILRETTLTLRKLVLD